MTAPHNKAGAPQGDPLWYKDAVIYELHVRAFYDSDGDGVGDFRGLAEKLDYLQDLGVTAIWLLPFYPSPLRDDGYDIADYTEVNPTYGSLADVRTLIREAHRRGLRVITELVCNHTSDQHAWFQRARQAKPGSAARDMYVWSDTPEKYRDARIIFKDFETSNWSWDPVANAYYWHRFYSHQPDLNFDNPQVHRAIKKALDFWLEMGVDGLRLDAIPYLYEREGTSCENLPETHTFLKELRRHVDGRFRDRMLLAEANQWPEDAVPYFGDGDECHMAFHFPVMPRLFMAIRMEDRYPIIDILDQTPAIPESAQWAMFLRNHDELTLEMVTDEERDYMYRVYANDQRARINLGIRRRLAPLLGNNRRKIELMNGLLFALPGTPVLYYGDEIGMGDNIYLGDRNGVRTPMQWSPDRNAGFSRASPQRLYFPVITEPEYHYETVNVETQQNNSSSLLWWMKRLIALRKRYRAFGRGSIEFLHPDNRKVLAFLRRHGDEQILVVANLSRYVQAVELDLSAFDGMRPVELFGRVEFPPVRETPYFLTLGPHAFYWFALEPHHTALGDGEAAGDVPELALAGPWQALLKNGAAELAELLPAYMRQRRWFRSKARTVRQAQVLDSLPVSPEAGGPRIALVQIEYVEGDPETYVLPLACARGPEAEQILAELPHAAVARLRLDSEPALLYDPSAERAFSAALLALLSGRRRSRGQAGELAAPPSRALQRALDARDALEPSAMRAEQSNTSVIYGDRFILKIFRRLEEGLNPDLEIGRFLTERGEFANTPPVAGALEYRQRSGEPMTLAILQGYVPNQGDAWSMTLDALGRYFERVLAEPVTPPSDTPRNAATLLALAEQELPEAICDQLGTYVEHARLLGQRTAELHLALAGGAGEQAFAPEPFTPFYQRSIYQSMRTQARQSLQLLRKQQRHLGEDTRSDAQRLLEREPQIMERFRAVLDRPISAVRTRHHGDYHLGQVLYTGKDFVIIDFEGEPARPLSERRIKRSPLRDVAGMLRSFSYAAYSALLSGTQASTIRPEDRDAAECWANSWSLWASAAFLASYLATAGNAPFLPRDRADLAVLLDAFTLDKALYELSYELNNRPTWLCAPLSGILQITDEQERAVGAP
ncbi:MAG TPA: maltose alpha-D-glucosyltransferase [Roseiflexaceae bacterium]|nr:maltose alpha-D-glucosyltransferase [Roseiflexaceae bacterium]